MAFGVRKGSVFASKGGMKQSVSREATEPDADDMGMMAGNLPPIPRSGAASSMSVQKEKVRGRGKFGKSVFASKMKMA